MRQQVREWVLSFALALLVVFLLRTFVFTIIRVDGNSMQPTLHDDERLFVTVFDAKFGSVERSDVVICRYPDRGSTRFVKRVVALPGDSVYREGGVTHIVYTIETESGTVIRDEALDPDVSISPYRSQPDYDAYVLGENEYFVVGDNRYNSHDSRDWNSSSSDNPVGPISKDMIVGHVRQVFWPLSNFRTVE